ncbi:MAG: L,D-transpeptidase family protein [Solirubrobacteraceae bacterium]
MRRRILAVFALMIAILLAGAGSLYAFDRSNAERIAEGVSVNGVAVGGLTANEAEVKLAVALLHPLDRPVTARFEGRTFTLTPEAAQIAIDIEGSVDRALAASREGNLLTRAWREVRGEPLDTDVEARVTWSRAAVRRVVDRVERKLTIDPRDASIDLETGKVDPQPSRDGRAVRAARLRREIERELLDDGETRSVRVRTQVVEPEVTTEELAEKYPAIIIVNRGAFELTYYENLEPAKTYRIAVGQVGLETPAGLYEITNKAVNPAWSVPNSDWAGDLAGTVVPGGTPQNPLKARWLGVYDGVGIHGTDAVNSIGTAASHGCIRMLIPEVVELYDQVPVGAPIYIA